MFFALQGEVFNIFYVILYFWKVWPEKSLRLYYLHRLYLYYKIEFSGY